VAAVWSLLAAYAQGSVKALGAGVLLRRVLRGRTIRFDRLHDFWLYLATTAVVTPALSGIAGAGAWVPLGREFWPTWRNWFFGDALANLVLTPLLLCLVADWRKLTEARPVRYLEGAAVFSGLIAAGHFAYQRNPGNPGFIGPAGYLPVAFLLLAAVRFGPAGASGSLATMSLLSIAATGAVAPGSHLPS